MKRPDVRYGRLALIACAAAAALLPLPPWWVERLYSRGIYPRVQPWITAASSLSPVALCDPAALLILIVLIWRITLRWKRAGARATLRAGSFAVLVVASVLYLWFLAFWGLNYRRVPLEQQLAYDASRITRERGLAFAQNAVAQANALRSAPLAAAGDDDLFAALVQVQTRLGAQRPVRVAAPRRSLLEIYFRRAAIDGMTDPFFLEVILNPDVLPSERPFVLAHEWAHLAGFADESEANFVAWLTCVRASSAAKYSGWLSAYQHVASGLRAADRRALAASLSPAVRADLIAERARFDRSNQRVRVVARGAYDAYLRANRIDEGIANYNAVVRLMLGVTFDSAWNPQLR